MLQLVFREVPKILEERSARDGVEVEVASEECSGCYDARHMARKRLVVFALHDLGWSISEIPPPHGGEEFFDIVRVGYRVNHRSVSWRVSADR